MKITLKTAVAITVLLLCAPNVSHSGDRAVGSKNQIGSNRHSSRYNYCCPDVSPRPYRPPYYLRPYRVTPRVDRYTKYHFRRPYGSSYRGTDGRRNKGRVR